MLKQMAERCNNALTDNALLVIEVNELRVELASCYGEMSQYKAELRKVLGLGPDDQIEGLDPLEIQEPKLVESTPQSNIIRNIPIQTDEPKKRTYKKKTDKPPG